MARHRAGAGVDTVSASSRPRRRGDRTLADRLEEEAAIFGRRFEDAFWVADRAACAMALHAANALAGPMLEAAQHFPDFRLPELFCGFAGKAVGVPVPYPGACSPQAWAAAAPLFMIRTMLGMRAQAADGSLELVRPHLPTWLGKLTVSDLRVGAASVDLFCHRWRGTTSTEVLRKTGDLEVTIRV